MKRIFFAIMLSFIVASCGVPALNSSQDVRYVNLNDLQPLPGPEDGDIQPLRVAISAVISPQGSAESYAPLLAYLEASFERPVEAIQRRTYMEVNELIEGDEVDLAFVCTSQYLVGSRDFGMRLLAAPQVNGEAAYRAQIIVPVGSTAESLDDLRWKFFAFTDPISFTGRLYPTYLLLEMGETPDIFFSHTIFSYSHDDAIRAVANGVVDGASVDKLVLDFARRREPDLTNRIRVIHTSEPFGMPPVVVGPHIRPQLQAQLQEFLLNLHRTPEGRAALQSLDYDKFVLISPGAYLSAEKIETIVGAAILEGK